MDGLLEKFDEIEIKNDTRLVETDRLYCEREHNLYIKVLYHFRSMYEELRAIQQKENVFYESVSVENGYNSYGQKYPTYRHRFVEINKEEFKKIIEHAHNKFIGQINSYFRNKYEVTIEEKKYDSYTHFEKPQDPSDRGFWSYNKLSDEETERLRQEQENYKKSYDLYLDDIISTELHYNSVVDDIFLSLGGFSFDEKVEKEIKDDAINAVTNSGRKTLNYSLKNSKISFDLLHSHKCSIMGRYEVSLDGAGYKAVLRALTYFDSDRTNTSIYINWCNKFVNYKKYEEDGIYDTHETNTTKVTHFKYYKNGKFEVTFDTHSSALQFSREYLGYNDSYESEAG